MPQNIVADASCLILFHKIGEIELLKKVYGEILITEEVKKEFNRPIPNWIEINRINPAVKSPLISVLDLGEAKSISLALEIDYPLLIIDEGKGRKIAKELGIPTTGSLGVIVVAKNKGILPSVKPIIEKIKETNFRLTEELVKRILSRAGE